jgi:hypothetical protein
MCTIPIFGLLLGLWILERALNKREKEREREVNDIELP